MPVSSSWPAQAVLVQSRAQPISGFENPPDGHHTCCKEYQCHPYADGNMHICHAVKSPTKAANKVHHRVEQTERLPNFRQHIDGIESATQKNQRRYYHHRDNLQFFKTICPNTDNEAEQAKRNRYQHQKRQHLERME